MRLHDRVLLASEKFDDVHLARIRLAIDFSRRPASFRLRAIVEEWEHDRIVREMY